MTRKLANHTALKEWASVVSALASGDQILMVRKGGIADAGFGVDAREFYLFPTYLHQRENQFKPEQLHHFVSTNRESEPDTLTIDTWAQVEQALTITNLALLQALEPFVIFTRDTLEQRYRFRPDQALHVMIVRTYKMRSPVSVRNLPEYAGCRSWISLEEEIDVEGSVSSLSDEEFERRAGVVMRRMEEAVALVEK